jgi:hypothetical protein
VWAVLGAILGPAALIILRVAPMGHCPMCWAPVRGWVSWCTWCGSDVRHAPPPDVDPGRTPSLGAATPPLPRAVPADAPVPPTRPSVTAAPTTLAPLAVRVQEPAARAPRAPVAKRSAGQSVVTPTAPGLVEVLASAVYVTGSVSLRPGSWYSLEFEDDVFRVRGPLDEDARAIAVTRPLDSLEASAFNGRLVVNGPRETVMVFMRLSGASADAIAEAITDAARTAATGAR